MFSEKKTGKGNTSENMNGGGDETALNLGYSTNRGLEGRGMRVGTGAGVLSVSVDVHILVHAEPAQASDKCMLKLSLL